MAEITTRAIIHGMRAWSRPRPEPSTSLSRPAIQSTTSVNENPVVVWNVEVAVLIKLFTLFYSFNLVKCRPQFYVLPDGLLPKKEFQNQNYEIQSHTDFEHERNCLVCFKVHNHVRCLAPLRSKPLTPPQKYKRGKPMRMTAIIRTINTTKSSTRQKNKNVNNPIEAIIVLV